VKRHNFSDESMLIGDGSFDELKKECVQINYL